jgi:hypothetical protein
MATLETVLEKVSIYWRDLTVCVLGVNSVQMRIASLDCIIDLKIAS